ncbi:MAG: orotidine-5'-phosphate decarboxylase [Myxococcota bacterium]|nr:orotidine-5'-phosphate decarboxylase [Myxococcota bacterium]
MPQPHERIIVALDVPTSREALHLVDEIGDLVTFYKVGLELLMGGGMEALLRTLVQRKRVFVDLKLPNDIPTTVSNAVRVASELGVKFLTLSHSVSDVTIRAAIQGRGERSDPKLLLVPVLSSLDKNDFARETGLDASQFGSDLVRRATGAKQAGVDGFIISGPEIGLLRATFPGVTLVSPAIRPAGTPTDDHKRSCSPGEAIRLGADYIVVGRPIRDAKDRRDAAKRIIDEIGAET